MTDILASDDLATLVAAQKRARRAEIELRAAQAALDLLLLNLQETYAIEQGDKLAPGGAILRVDTPQGD